MKRSPCHILLLCRCFGVSKISVHGQQNENNEHWPVYCMHSTAVNCGSINIKGSLKGFMGWFSLMSSSITFILLVWTTIITFAWIGKKLQEKGFKLHNSSRLLLLVKSTQSGVCDNILSARTQERSHPLHVPLPDHLTGQRVSIRTFLIYIKKSQGEMEYF